MNNSLMIFLSQLVSMSPMLLVCLGGMVIAGLWWRRAPKAAMFAMAGLGITLLAMLLSPLIQVYVVRSGAPATVGQTVAVMSIAFGLVRAVGMGLLIAGVFAGRSNVEAGFPVASQAAQPPLANLAPPGR
jgi:FtsH-binding integral membrane protein